jgi:PBP1b-binding outer membrane lipoprotein LpoB
MHGMNLTLATLLLAVTGCTPAHRIQTGGPESITTTSKIDIQDVQSASAGMIDGLLRSGIFQDFQERHGRKPILLFKNSAIVNDTSTRLPMPMLTGDIKAELLQSQFIELASTYVGASGRAQDAAASANARLQAFRERDANNDATPDFSITGSITEMRSRAGTTRQLDLQFSMTLTKWASGNVAIWSETVKISKQGDRPAVGL